MPPFLLQCQPLSTRTRPLFRSTHLQIRFCSVRLKVRVDRNQSAEAAVWALRLELGRNESFPSITGLCYWRLEDSLKHLLVRPVHSKKSWTCNRNTSTLCQGLLTHREPVQFLLSTVQQNQTPTSEPTQFDRRTIKARDVLVSTRRPDIACIDLEHWLCTSSEINSSCTWDTIPCINGGALSNELSSSFKSPQQ